VRHVGPDRLGPIAARDRLGVAHGVTPTHRLDWLVRQPTTALPAGRRHRRRPRRCGLLRLLRRWLRLRRRRLARRPRRRRSMGRAVGAAAAARGNEQSEERKGRVMGSDHEQRDRGRGPSPVVARREPAVIRTRSCLTPSMPARKWRSRTRKHR
jgi:hypothetical protein